MSTFGGCQRANMSDYSSLCRYWGKTGDNGEWHSAVHHMLDVGCVAERLISDRMGSGFRTFFANEIGIAADRAPRWAGFLVALHDLGKISPGFQHKVPERCPAGMTIDQTALADHGVISYCALSAILERGFTNLDHSNSIARALGGHHGVFSRAAVDELRVGAGKGHWVSEREAAAEAIRLAFGVDWQELHCSERPLSGAWLMALAGLTSVADWIGSDKSHFTFTNGVGSVAADYLNMRRLLAGSALDAVGFRVPPVCSTQPFKTLFGFAPNSIQDACARIAEDSKGPALILVEAPMGGGKTEAALYAATIFQRECGTAGVYFALPTQATSNQMLQRMTQFLKSQFPAGDTNLMLLHGLASLNETFGELRASAGSDPIKEDSAIYDQTGDTGRSAETAARKGRVQAQEWFCGRKRGLLSPYAVGTVDQALLGVLSVKHMFVRLFGLASKTVIIDEVHAYDAFTSTILDRMLSWLGALGCPVVILSATLPGKRRNELLAAYSNQTVDFETMPNYPRVFGVARNGFKTAVALPVEHPRTVFLEATAGGTDGALNTLAARLAKGGCAAWICNTVNSAQETFKRLLIDDRFKGAEKILFHARFPVEQRLKIEERVVKTFGKMGERPSKAVVVATQVIEQSLDLDFDVMISELAPIDLLLQRVGRLHRHTLRDAERPAAVKTPVLMWLKPELNAKQQPDFRGSAIVYAPYILAKTLSLLQGLQEPKLDLPGDIERSIETVYCCKEESGSDMFELMNEYKEGSRSRGNVAKQWLLPVSDSEDGFFTEMNEPQFDADEDATAQKLTRYSEQPSLTLICAFRVGEETSLTPDGSEPLNMDTKPGRAQLQRLLQRSVKISNPFWYRYFAKQPTPMAWIDTALLRQCRFAVFEHECIKENEKVLRISDELGLTYSKKET